jgi:hypothetical protein
MWRLARCVDTITKNRFVRCYAAVVFFFYCLNAKLLNRVLENHALFSCDDDEKNTLNYFRTIYIHTYILPFFNWLQ